MTVPSGEIDRGETSEAICVSFTMLFEVIVAGKPIKSISDPLYIGVRFQYFGEQNRVSFAFPRCGSVPRSTTPAKLPSIFTKRWR